MNKDERKVIQFLSKDLAVGKSWPHVEEPNSSLPGKQEPGQSSMAVHSTAGAKRSFNCVSSTPDRNMVSVPTTITMFTCMEFFRDA